MKRKILFTDLSSKCESQKNIYVVFACNIDNFEP